MKKLFTFIFLLSTIVLAACSSRSSSTTQEPIEMFMFGQDCKLFVFTDKESFELFSDGAAAFIFQASSQDKGVIASLQHTWSEGAHDTEIRGGLTSYHPKKYSEKTKTDFMFDMKGKKILLLSAHKLPDMFQEFQEKTHLALADVDYIIPHQASRALSLVMDKLGITEDQYLNIVTDYGNMVSVSVPFGLAYSLDHGLVKEGDVVYLLGTAAGMTVNMLALKL